MFNKMVRNFTESMLMQEKGGEIQMCFSQKVEKRRLGNVAGVLGLMKWHTTGIREPEEFEFLLSEHDLTPYDPEDDDSNQSFFAIQRGIRISLRPTSGLVSEAVFEILSKVDSRFALNLKNMQKCMVCKHCFIKGNHGYFPLTDQLWPKTNRCSPNLEHTLEKSLLRLIEKSFDPEPFKLQSLMDMDKDDLKLETFEESDIKRRMVNGELERGEQIWIYHDAVTNSNLVARINPYAHVIVYVGPKLDQNGKEVLGRDGKCIHEVVHVAKSSWRGLLVAGIFRVDVMSVVKPYDKVFLGHKIRACQFAGNIRNKIATRAIACAEKPRLLFEYDHR